MRAAERKRIIRISENLGSLRLRSRRALRLRIPIRGANQDAALEMTRGWVGPPTVAKTAEGLRG